MAARTKIEITQFDIANVELQNKIFTNATDADSISTFHPDSKQPTNQSIVSPTTNKIKQKIPTTKTSHQQTREFVDSDNDNRTSKEARKILEGPCKVYYCSVQ